MSQASSSQSSSKEYVVRIPKSTKKRFNMMRFSTDHGADFFKTWTQCKMERENNMKEYRNEEEMPKFGAGSEYGREQRDEARRKRYGINIKKYRLENQPWLLNVGGKNVKKFKGIRDGGVGENVSWFVFMQGKDGAFEAYPIEEWYNFHPINRYKALSAEEAEEEFVRRDKIMNYFQVMYEKKIRKDGTEVEEDEGKKTKSRKSLMLSELDDWVSDDEEEEERNGEEDDDDELAGSSKRKKKKPSKNSSRKAGGKKRDREAVDSDASYEEESDEYNEGAEHDYISTDSSDSDLENDEVALKELKGVDQDDALRKLLDSDDEEDEDKQKEDNEDDDENGDGKDDDKDRKKKKRKREMDDQDDSEDSSESSSDESKKAKDNAEVERKKAVNELKQKVKENPLEMPETKKPRLEPGASGSSSSTTGALAAGDSMEDAIRKYLMRKPMTTTELLKNFKKKKEFQVQSSEQLVTTIAQMLKKINPVKRMIKGKMYLSLKPT